MVPLYDCGDPEVLLPCDSGYYCSPWCLAYLLPIQDRTDKRLQLSFYSIQQYSARLALVSEVRDFSVSLWQCSSHQNFTKLRFRAAADFFVTWLDLEESFLFWEQQKLPSAKSCATSTLAKDIWLPVLWSVYRLPAFFVFCWERRQFPFFLLSGRKGFRIH